MSQEKITQVESGQGFTSPFSGDFSNLIWNEGFQWVRGHELAADPPANVEAYPTDDVWGDREWVRSVEEWALVPPHNLSRNFQVVRFDDADVITPTKGNPTLFREFAELDPLNRDDILQFANRYGLLGAGNLFFPRDYPLELLNGVPAEIAADLAEYIAGRRSWSQVRCTDKSQLPDLSLRCTETQFHWAREILDLRLAMLVRDAVLRADHQQLSELIVMRENHRSAPGAPRWSPFVHNSAARGVLGQIRPTAPEVLDRWSYNLIFDLDIDPVKRPMSNFAMARAYLHLAVNSSLSNRAFPQLSLSRSPKENELRIEPQDLRTAMWLQLAESIAANKEYRQCCCRRWFEVPVAVDGRSKRRAHCSDACKSRAYRERTGVAEAKRKVKPRTKKRK